MRHGFAFSSGVGCVDSIMKLFRSGDHIVCGENVYGGSFRLFDRLLQEDKGLRVVYRELPILGPDSVSADFTIAKTTPPPPDCDNGPFHSPDHYPPACWRPFADSSPFNQRIPASAQVERHGVHAVEALA